MHQDSRDTVMDEDVPVKSEYGEHFLNFTSEESAERVFESSTSCDQDFTRLGHNSSFFNETDASTSSLYTGENLTSNDPPDGVKKKCPICAGSLLESYLPQHLSTVHNISNEDIPKYMQTNLKYCSLCGKSFLRNILLKRHLRTQHKQFEYSFGKNLSKIKTEYQSTYTEFTCDICKEIFDSKSSLSSHIEAQHFELSDRIFNFKPEPSMNPRSVNPLNKCDYCNVTFKFPAHLQVHKVQFHPEVMPSCNICGRIFTLKRYLLEHIKNKHDNEFLCKICQKPFTYKYELAEHLKTHKLPVLNRSWECHVCKKRLTSKRNLLIHKIGHVKPIKTTPWQCNTCNKYLSSKRSLLKHKKDLTNCHVYL